MADIFISYASDDLTRVEPLAKALEGQGWSVWWDRTIPPGKSFDQVIEEAITAAKCVVVLWSEISKKSDWVKEEATIGKRRQILVPAKIDPVEPPIGFGLIQAADLTDWKAESDNHESFILMTGAISKIVKPSLVDRQHDGQRDNRLDRMFALPPFYLNPEELINLGMKGGPMDGGTNANNSNSIPVGYLFFGQFIDHDITFDITNSLSAANDVNEVNNIRKPALDLSCLYGLGPEANNHLYFNLKPPSTTAYNQAKLLTGVDGTAVSQPAELAQHDLCRTTSGTAIIGDPRNDENRIISQLHLAMIRFHNYVVEQLHSHDSNLTGSALYEEAREIVTWHYQWVVINDFLVKMCGKPVVADILANGCSFYCVETHQEAYIPFEFNVAAFRFGHSMIPDKIQIQSGQSALDLFGIKLGLGFQPLDDAEAVVDWNVLVDTGSGAVVQMAKKLDSQLSEILLDLPFIAPGDLRSMASRNLLRGQHFLLPSGENVAEAMHRPLSEIDKVSKAAQAKAASAADLAVGTPLWFYILVEAEEIGRETTYGQFDPCEGLGPIGARIVAETIIGLIELDEHSFLAAGRSWWPDPDSIGVATLGDMLTYTFS